MLAIPGEPLRAVATRRSKPLPAILYARHPWRAPSGRRYATFKTAPGYFVCSPSLASPLRAVATRRSKPLPAILYARHPWRAPFGPSLRDVQNRSQLFVCSPSLASPSHLSASPHPHGLQAKKGSQRLNSRRPWPISSGSRRDTRRPRCSREAPSEAAMRGRERGSATRFGLLPATASTRLVARATPSPLSGLFCTRFHPIRSAYKSLQFRLTNTQGLRHPESVTWPRSHVSPISPHS